MTNNLFLIYSIIETFDLYSKSLITKKNIIEYVKFYILISNNYEAKKTSLDLFSIIIDLNDYIRNGILFESEYISINKNHILYSDYIDKNEKCKETMYNCIESFNNLFLSEVEKKSNDESLVNENLNNEKNELEEEIYVIYSFTDITKFYFINKDLTKCSCKSYQYCQLSSKKCKHLENINNNNLLIFNKNKKSCNCNEYEYNNTCDHLNEYNDKEDYLIEIGI